jgi:plastocyanin
MKARRAALLLSVVLVASSAAALDETIVIEATRLDPAVLKTTTGQRVDFVNRSQRAVHVEFGGDVRQHHVVQIPAGGPIWVVFHRPGTHPYVVHVYERREIRALSGMVEVVEDATHKWDSQTCGVIVMGECIEP